MVLLLFQLHKSQLRTNNLWKSNIIEKRKLMASKGLVKPMDNVL